LAVGIEMQQLWDDAPQGSPPGALLPPEVFANGKHRALQVQQERVETACGYGGNWRPYLRTGITSRRCGIQEGWHSFNQLWHTGGTVVAERELSRVIGAKAQNATAAAAHLLLERASAR
jgi:hypothetical protein